MKRIYILIAALALGVLLAVVGYFTENLFLRVAGLVVLSAGYVSNRVWLRCSHCGKYCGGRYEPGKPCPFCGRMMK